MTNKCEVCKNKEICKYKTEYEKMLESFPTVSWKKDIFEVELNCKYYEKEKQLSTQEMEQLLRGNYVGCNKSACVLDTGTTTHIDPNIKYELR